MAVYARCPVCREVFTHVVLGENSHFEPCGHWGTIVADFTEGS